MSDETNASMGFTLNNQSKVTLGLAITLMVMVVSITSYFVSEFRHLEARIQAGDKSLEKRIVDVEKQCIRLELESNRKTDVVLQRIDDLEKRMLTRRELDELLNKYFGEAGK